MVAFKAHATLAFGWRDERASKPGKAGEAMGGFGKLTQVKDLPGKREFAAKVKTGMQRIEEGARGGGHASCLCRGAGAAFAGQMRV